MKTVFAVLMVLSGFLIVHVMHLYNPDDLPGYVGYAVGAVLSIMGIFASMVGALLLSNRITIIIGVELGCLGLIDFCPKSFSRDHCHYFKFLL